MYVNREKATTFRAATPSFGRGRMLSKGHSIIPLARRLNKFWLLYKFAGLRCLCS